MLKAHKPILITFILLTTIPFFLLLRNVDFRLYSTNINTFWGNLALGLANILGFIGTILLVWEFILGNRYLASLWTDDVVWVNKLHSWIGKYGILTAFIHPVLEMYIYLENWLWLFYPSFKNSLETYITFGRIAFILLIVIYFSSAILRSRLKYRPWLYIHYLSYPIMFFSFLHALEIGTYLNKYIALKALWFTLMTLYLGFILFRLVVWSGWFKPKFQIENQFIQNNDVLYLVLKPLKRKIIPKSGQFMYIQIKNFGESHPFSVMEYDPQTGNLIFGIKMVGHFTQKLALLKVSDKLMLDGPYGVFTQEAQNFKPKVIIAGGVGATPFVELVKQYKSPSTVFINANRTINDVVARDTLKKELGSNYFDFLSNDDQTKGENIINSQVNIVYLKAILGENNFHQYQYFICGSKNFMMAVQSMLEKLNVQPNQIYTEGFSL